MLAISSEYLVFFKLVRVIGSFTAPFEFVKWSQYFALPEQSDARMSPLPINGLLINYLFSMKSPCDIIKNMQKSNFESIITINCLCIMPINICTSTCTLNILASVVQVMCWLTHLKSVI